MRAAQNFAMRTSLQLHPQTRLHGQTSDAAIVLGLYDEKPVRQGGTIRGVSMV